MQDRQAEAVFYGQKRLKGEKFEFRISKYELRRSTNQTMTIPPKGLLLTYLLLPVGLAVMVLLSAWFFTHQMTTVAYAVRFGGPLLVAVIWLVGMVQYLHRNARREIDARHKSKKLA
jgi:hypothetical protein